MVSLASAGAAGAVEEPSQDATGEALVAETPVSCFAPTPHSFSDMGSSGWAETAVSWLVESEITAGIGNGKYGPQGDVTRAQMAVFLHSVAGSPAPVGSDPFTDVPLSARVE